MSVMYQGKCINGIVYLVSGDVETVLPDCNILGDGKAPESTGIVFGDQSRFWYVPLVTPNIKTLLQQLTSLIDSVKSITTSLQTASALIDDKTVVTGQATIAPSTVTGSQISSKAQHVGTQLDSLKQEVEKLAGSLV